MQRLTVQDVYDWLNSIAPFETAESYDNVGLLVGAMQTEIKNILITLDVTPETIDEAVKHDAQLIIAHHPIMFHGTKHILENEYEGRILSGLIRNHLSMIASHTNLDQSPMYSGSAVLAGLLELKNIQQNGYVFVGEIPDGPISASELSDRISNCENEPVYIFGKENSQIIKLGICGGAFDNGFALAKEMGAQAYLTGEIHHHIALEAAGNNFVLYQGGHFGTEAPLVPVLSKALQKHLEELKYIVNVYPSVLHPYR